MVTGIAGSDDMSSSPLMTRSLDPALLYTSSINQDTNNSDQSESSSTKLVLEGGGAGRKYEFIMLAFFFCKYSISEFGLNRFKN
jgi:hypothetical protein